MKQVILLLLFIIICCSGLSAQNITLDLSAHPGRKVSLCLMNGTQNDTIFNGVLDNKGRAIIRVPTQYKDYRGMASLRPDLPGAYFEFIVAGEDMILSCKEEYPHGGNVVFGNSPENEALQSRFMDQARRRQKIGSLSDALALYGRTDALYPVLDREIVQLEAAQASFEKQLVGSPLYASGFIRLHNFVNREVAALPFADSLQMEQVRTYVRDSLDINGLFTSGLWFATLNGLLALYDNGMPHHGDFTGDMSLLLRKAGPQRTYNTLAEDLFAICESMGWNDSEGQLACFLINDGRIREPAGKLQMLMTLFKLAKGSKAPPLSQGVLLRGKILLVFYESGCGPCENQMRLLKGNYPLLREKGYEVVSVSADMDAAIFRNTAETFPWKDRLCDFKGFQGEDFQNYGVLGTPAFYLIDENGIVTGRYARMEDMKIIGD